MKTNSIIIACLAIIILSVPLLYPNRSHFKYNLFYKFSDKSENKTNSKDTIRVKVLNKKAFDLRLTNPEKTIIIADSALIIAKNINYLSGIGEALRVKGVGYSYLNNIEFAVKNYILALNYFKKTGEQAKKARVYNNIGNLYKKDDYKRSLEYFIKALKLIENLADEELESGISFNIASIYNSLSDYSRAMEFYNKSNKYFLKKKDSINIAINHLNTAIIHYKLSQYDKSKSNLLKAIEISLKIKTYSILPACYTTLADISINNNQFQLAKKYLNKGYTYSKMLKNKKYEKIVLHTAYELEYRQKNYLKALKNLKLIHEYDSITLSEQLSDNILKTSKHYFQLQKLQENELTIAKQRYKETIYWWILTGIFALILLSIIIGILISYHIKKKGEKEKIAIKSKINILEQKALQASMNPHFLYNILSTIQYFISQDNNQTANTILSKFAKLMRKHLEICMNSTIALNEEIQYLDLYLSLEKIRFARKLEYSINFSPEVSEDDILIPSMLIQPFVENAIWHGLMPKEDGGFIKIDIDIYGNFLTVCITDNGIGILNSLNNKKSVHISRGLELIKERVNLMNQLSDRKITISQEQMGESGTQVVIKMEL